MLNKNKKGEYIIAAGLFLIFFIIIGLLYYYSAQKVPVNEYDDFMKIKEKRVFEMLKNRAVEAKGEDISKEKELEVFKLLENRDITPSN